MRSSCHSKAMIQCSVSQHTSIWLRTAQYYYYETAKIVALHLITHLLNLILSHYKIYMELKILTSIDNGIIHWHTWKGSGLKPGIYPHKPMCVDTHEGRMAFNTLRPRQSRRHFADEIFKCIFFSENVAIFIKASLKFAPKYPIDNSPALVSIMARRQTGDKPLSEQMMA